MGPARRRHHPLLISLKLHAGFHCTQVDARSSPANRGGETRLTDRLLHLGCENEKSEVDASVNGVQTCRGTPRRLIISCNWAVRIEETTLPWLKEAKVANTSCVKRPFMNKNRDWQSEFSRKSVLNKNVWDNVSMARRFRHPSC